MTGQFLRPAASVLALLLASLLTAVPVAAQKKKVVEDKIPVVQPTNSAHTITLALEPQRVAAVAVGGGGRYLAFVVAAANGDNKITVVDLKNAVILPPKSIPATDEKPVIAADLKCLYVANPTGRTMVRYDLDTLKKESTAPLPTEMTVMGLAAPPAGSGPLMMIARVDRIKEEAFLVDPVTLKRIDDSTNYRPPIHIYEHTRIHGLGDSKRFLMKAGGSGTAIIDPAHPAWTEHVHQSPALTAAADGRYLLATGQVFHPNGDVIGATAANVKYIPALNGGYFLSFRDGFLGVHTYPDAKPHFTLAHKDGVYTHYMEDYYFLNPELEVLATLNKDGTTLSIVPLNTWNEVRNLSTRPVLLEKSVPVAIRGKPYKAQLGVITQFADPEFRLDAGPPGMSISKDGAITWPVPTDFAETRVEPVITVTAGLKETARPIRISVVAAAPAKVASVTQPAVTTLPLPGVADTVCTGGAGRFLLFAIPKEKVIAVFDASERKIVKAWPVAEPEFCVAAGKDHAYVLLVESRVLQRYSLKTLEREWSKPCPVDVIADGMVMGSASAGPLAINAKWTPGDINQGNVTFIDPETLKVLEFEPRNDHGFKYVPKPPPCWNGLMRASADGRVFTWSDRLGHDSTKHLVEPSPGKLNSRSQSMSGQMLLPSANGRYFYSIAGSYDDNLKPIHQTTRVNSWAGHVFLPADSGPLFMKLEQKAPPQGRGAELHRSGNDGPIILPGTATFHLSGGSKPLGSIDNIDGIELENFAWRSTRGKLMYDMRIHLMPDHGLLVGLAGNDDNVALHPFDLDKLLERSGEEYLLFASEPPGNAVRGTKYTYTPVVKAKAGGAVVKLQSGPDGMAMIGGALAWTIPADLAMKEAAVVLSVTDAKGKEQFQSFRIKLTGGTVVEANPQPKPDIKPKLINPPPAVVPPESKDRKP